MKKKIDDLVVKLISNTIKRNTSRIDDLITIANDMEQLVELTGSKEEASKLLRLSPIMISKFLSIKKLSPAVQKLVRERKVDSVQALYDIKSLKPDEQLIVAKYLSSKELSASDIKNLMPEKNQNPKRPIIDIINQFIASRNIKIYTAFILCPNIKGVEKAKRLISEKIDSKYIHDISLDENIVKISLNKEGYSFLKNETKLLKTTIKKYLNTILNG